jgi:DMSO/TMAO reductase YedYZ molybdopterin-dependent catalytic subunit
VNRQVARSIHFFIMLYFVGFIVVHVSLVFITGMRKNLNHITLGTDNGSWEGAIIAFIAIALLAAFWKGASPFTLKHARLVQRTGRFIVGWAKGLVEFWDPKTQYSEKDISPFLWPNGLLPTSAEYKELAFGGYQAYKLRVDGLVEKPQEFSFEQLKEMPKQEQITVHYCIQGWSGVAKWAGVPMRHILELVKPTAAARYAVFYSFGEGGDGGMYYDAHKMQNMKHELTTLAYEMNGQQLSTVHGAPLRLRCENQLGFKQVKWIRAIEFVDDFSRIGRGEGGYNEDHEFYGYRMPI